MTKRKGGDSDERRRAYEFFKAEAEKRGITLDEFINVNLRRLLEKAWEIQQRTGKPVPIDQLYKELGGKL